MVYPCASFNSSTFIGSELSNDAEPSDDKNGE